ncbi:hypothetical protein JZ751_028553, partial [Albula glossodonta]
RQEEEKHECLLDQFALESDTNVLHKCSVWITGMCFESSLGMESGLKVDRLPWKNKSCPAYAEVDRLDETCLWHSGLRPGFKTAGLTFESSCPEWRQRGSGERISFLL